MSPVGKVLWWGRFDPDYSRNRVVRELLRQLDYELSDFMPHWPLRSDWEARWRQLPRPAFVWVPCFRQRDVLSAARWARHQKVPLVFDPLISAYDKQVFERNKFRPDSWRARRLLRKERRQMQQADLLIADTDAHSRFFAETFDIPSERLATVHVGAEEGLFYPRHVTSRDAGAPVEVLFYGSFIGLQGPQTIVDAARLYRGPPVVWRLVGDGPLLVECRRRAKGLTTVQFEPWKPYAQLPEIICAADIVLGIFGTSDKAARVIPNKVYQALACGKPLVTRFSPAYPAVMRERPAGVEWVEPGSPESLCAAVAKLAAEPTRFAESGVLARRSYEEHFSMQSIREQLRTALTQLTL